MRVAILMLFAADLFARPLTVMTPLKGEKAYQIAGETFTAYWKQVTGEAPALVTYINPYDRNLPAGDIVLIGSDAVHPVVHELIRARTPPSLGLEYGGDNYRLLSVQQKQRTVLIIAGGSGRSTIYGVYDFFRRQAGVEYFWDGDRVPKRKSIALAPLDLLEKPRFEYRGLRYFAHRGLHRFQAEHWDLEDWKKEIDWLLKKRFNLFMLRTGIDDLFQRAFPGEVDYPPEDGRDPDAEDRSYNDRTSFWPLKYRGELRRKVLSYAFDRGLLHPEDTGTLTHWYSPTPSSFYRSHADFPVTTDQTAGYTLPSAAIWDIESEATWEAYWRLTETHIREFGRTPRLFHTIGMAERLFGGSEEENLQRKLYVYRKTQQELRERYPDAPLLIASWDFYGWWKNQDVDKLLNEFDPRRTIVLEYTADNASRVTYRDWNLTGRFPWIFGIFHGYAANSDSHGDYALLDKRLAEAAADKQCRGLVMWSEISHNDTFMLEYLADNSWQPVRRDAAAAAARYCEGRYKGATGLEMSRLWPAFLKVSQTGNWANGNRSATFRDPQFRILRARTFFNLPLVTAELARIRPAMVESPGLLDGLATLAATAYEDPLWRRDSLDMARTVASRGLLVSLLAGADAAAKGQSGRVRKLAAVSRRLMASMADVTGASDDFSMAASLQRLGRPGVKVNSHSEQTLKSNSENDYCRSHHYELVRGLYTPELESYWQWVLKKVEAGDRIPWKRPAEFDALSAALRDRWYATPLAQMAPTQARGAAELGALLRSLGGLVRELLAETAS